MDGSAFGQPWRIRRIRAIEAGVSGRPWGVVLAGGGARRMGGGDKPLQRLGSASLLDHVIGAIAPQVDRLAISANGDAARFAAWRLPVLADAQPGQGPLGGLLAALAWARAGGAAAVLCVPGDTPFLPADLVGRLAAADTAIACAGSGGRTHFAVTLVSVGLADDLAGALANGTRAVRDWMAPHQPATVAFVGTPDPFTNINTPAELRAAGAALRTLRS